MSFEAKSYFQHINFGENGQFAKINLAFGQIPMNPVHIEKHKGLEIMTLVSSLRGWLYCNYNLSSFETAVKKCKKSAQNWPKTALNKTQK